MNSNSVANYLRCHPNDRLGGCNQSCGSSKMDENGDETIVGNSDIFNVKLYPNPFADQFKLNVEASDETRDIQVRIFEVLGQLIQDKTTIGLQTDVTFGSNLQKGVYLVEVSQGDKIQVLRVIKSE